MLVRLIHNQEGSLTRIVSDESIVHLVKGDPYVVIVHSIRRTLSLRLHELLKPSNEYHSLIQVLPHLNMHGQIFGFCPPVMRIEKKTLFVLSTTESGEQDEGEESRCVDEIIDMASNEYPLIGFKVEKKHMGFKGTMLDRDSATPFKGHHVVQRMEEECSEIVERVINKLDDFAPDVVAELASAIRTLEKRNLSEEDAGAIAVNLRRSLEILADLLTSGNPDRMIKVRQNRPRYGEKYKDLLWDYLCGRFKHNQALRDELWLEVQQLGNLLNRGVHDHWTMELVRPLAVRTILVMNSLLFPVKAGVVQYRMGDDLFDWAERQ